MDTCKVDEINCVEIVKEELGEEKLGRIFTYASENQNYSDALLCKNPESLDRQFEVVDADNNVWTYWRLVLSANESQKHCDYSGSKFHVIFLRHLKQAAESKYPSLTTDRNKSLLELTDKMGMGVYLGSPKFPVSNQGNAWDIDTDYLGAYKEFLRRIYADIRVRFRSYSSLRGVYQTHEVALGSNSTKAIALHAFEADVLHSFLPGREYVISPYIRLKKMHFLAPLAAEDDKEVRIKKILKTFDNLLNSGIDVIAPQDGRGAGHASYYWDWQLDSPISAVDPILASYLPEHEQKKINAVYHESIRNLFQEFKTKTKKKNVSLWANIEAFEPGKIGENDPRVSREKTTKARLDKAITHVYDIADQVIAYMYDPFFDNYKVNGKALPEEEQLLYEIKNDYTRPIIVKAFRFESLGPGFVLKGHGLMSNNIQIEIRSASHPDQVVIKALGDDGWIDVINNVLWISFNTDEINHDGWIEINAIVNGKKSNEAYSLFIP